MKKIHGGMGAALLVVTAACASVEGKSVAAFEKVPVVGFDQLFRRVDSVLLVTPPEEAIGMASGLVVLPTTFVLSDVTRGNLKVFSKQGILLKTIGKPGDGPGEFRRPMSLIQDGRGRLVVLDQKRSMLSLRDTSGALLEERVVAGTWDGLTALPGSDQLLLIGARVRKGKETGVGGEHMALHMVDSTGTIATSYHSFKWPSDPLQATFTHHFAAAVGEHLVGAAFVSNQVYLIDRRTGKETTMSVGGPWYRPPNWSKQPAGQSAGQRVMLWARQQILLVGLFGIDGGTFLAQFRSFTADGDELYQYVLADTAGVSLVSTSPTRMRIITVNGGTAYGIVPTAEGDVAVETLKLIPPARP